jgi:hypothetical protein
VNLVFLFLSMQYIRLTTYYNIFVKQLMTDFNLFQTHLLSQNGNNTVEYTALTYSSLPVLTTLTSVQSIRCSHLSHCTHLTIIKETLFLTASGWTSHIYNIYPSLKSHHTCHCLNPCLNHPHTHDLVLALVMLHSSC